MEEVAKQALVEEEYVPPSPGMVLMFKCQKDARGKFMPILSARRQLAKLLARREGLTNKKFTKLYGSRWKRDVPDRLYSLGGVKQDEAPVL